MGQRVWICRYLETYIQISTVVGSYNQQSFHRIIDVPSAKRAKGAKAAPASGHPAGRRELRNPSPLLMTLMYETTWIVEFGKLFMRILNRIVFL